MFDIALGIFLFLSPIFFMPIQVGEVNSLQFYIFGTLGNSSYNYQQLLFFYFGIVALFITAMLSKPQREFNNKWAVYLFISFCLSVCFHPIGVKVFGGILLGFLLYYLVTVYVKDYRKLFKFILCASALNTIFALLQFFGINLIYRATGRIDGLMCSSVHLGAYQLIVLPVCYAINPLLALIPITGIILSKSFTAIFLMLCWSAFMITRKIRSYPIVLSILTLTVLFIIFNWQSILGKLNVRLMVWLPTIREIFNHPFIGYGLKPFRITSSLGTFENPCSIYLQIAWCLGIFALIPIFTIKTKDKIILASIVLALLVGLEKSIMDFPRLAGTIIVLFGLLNITKGKTNENQV